jgi:hypothetical protein
MRCNLVLVTASNSATLLTGSSISSQHSSQLCQACQVLVRHVNISHIRHQQSNSKLVSLTSRQQMLCENRTKAIPHDAARSGHACTARHAASTAQWAPPTAHSATSTALIPPKRTSNERQHFASRDPLHPATRIYKMTASTSTGQLLAFVPTSEHPRCHSRCHCHCPVRLAISCMNFSYSLNGLFPPPPPPYCCCCCWGCCC